MKKYNKSEIMKNAWSTYRKAQQWNGSHSTFSECLKLEWAVAKSEVEINEEMIRYFNETCMKAVRNGDDAVDDAFRVWYDDANIKETPTNFTAHMRAWNAAKAVFRNVIPTFSTELVSGALFA